MTVYKGYTVTVLRSPCPYGLYYPPQQNGIAGGVVQQLLNVETYLMDKWAIYGMAVCAVK